MEIVFLKDLVDKIIDNRGKNPKYSFSGIEVIETGCISGSKKYPDYSLVKKYVDNNTYKNWFRNGHPCKGDLLIITVGNNVGSISLMNENRGCITQNLIGLRLKENVCSDFIYYYLSQKEVFNYFQGLNIGSAQPSIKVPHLLNFELNIPDFLIQQKIAGILSDLDGKIFLNYQTNKTLEFIAQAFFKSWFIDFDPVRAKIAAKKEGKDPELAAMCVISGKSEVELQQMAKDDFAELQETASLFPDELVETELGEVPKGWEITNINAVTASIFSGGTPSTKEMTYWNGEIPWLSSGETRNKIIVSTEKSITEIAVKKSSTKLAIFGDILIASAGQGHTRGQTSFNAIECYINQSIVALRANDKVSSYWLYYCLEPRYDEMRSLSDSHSSRGSLTTKLLASMPVILPTQKLVVNFDKVIKSMLAQQIKNLKEIKILTDTRDALLPKLISGDIDVSTLASETEYEYSTE
ncbi:restriction endonuclease subunit S [Acinetobacter cumulans]|uniref:restriction endonuclease subunit S n=1 Tax=Acinetobacter cumulans TaxID=2136182 RepID=UPI000D116261|nr:restriction endonuclease subunit S [Acinetobacter cumulans]QCO20271.1 restriction endonuclease subunit S [Acinetobacter cumulans]